jgi:hypothetical protein
VCGTQFDCLLRGNSPRLVTALAVEPRCVQDDPVGRLDEPDSDGIVE